MVTRILSTAVVVAVLLGGGAARAQGRSIAAPTATSTPTSTSTSTPTSTPTSAPPTDPTLHHAPLTTAPEHERVAIGATIDRPDLVRRAFVVYRHGDAVDEVPFERSALGGPPYLAVIPPQHVVRPRLAYAIEIERTDGARVPVFASRDAMQSVEVVGDTVDAEEEALLARLHGRRFVTSARGEYVDFGTAPAQVCAGPCPAPGGGSPALVNESIHDGYYQIEGAFTYRMLRTVSEFGIRGGVYRGRSVVPNEFDPSKYDVGVNYGAPWIRLRATDWLHLEGEFLTSVTEVGFSLGGGGAVLVGDAYGSHLTLGFETIDVFGTRGYSRFDVALSPRWSVAPTVEVTNMPHASTAGVRLLMDVGYDVGAGFRLALRGGYQARTFASGGPAAGGAVTYAF